MNFFRRYAFWWILLLLPFFFFFCMSFGNRMISPLEIFGSDSLARLLLSLRLRCLVTGFVVGASLAVSGVGYQSVLRNPLAEPFILGVSGGASLGAAFAIAAGLSNLSFLFLPLCAFIGAVAVLFIVLMIARGAGSEYANNVLLSGVIVGTVCSSILMFVISVVGLHKLNSITWWMLGNLAPKNDILLIAVAVVVLLGTFILFLLGREANVISMGSEMAYHLGVAPEKLALVILLISSFMAAAAVSLSGIIGFVGLIIPHILRGIIGADHRRLFPLALLCGGIFLMLCDTVSRTLLAPQVVPVGVITAFLGGPFFIWLLNRRRKNSF